MQCLALSVVKFTNTLSAPFLFWEKLQREKGRKGVFPVKFQYRFLLAALDCCSSEYKGRSSQSCDWHLAAFPLCWAGWGWPGQEEVPVIHRDHFPFSPSLSWARSYCLGFPETADCWFGCLSSFIFATLQWLWLFGPCICTKEYPWFIIFFFLRLPGRNKGSISVKWQAMVVFVWIQFPCMCSCVELSFKTPPY